MTPPPSISRITVEDCSDDRRVERIVIQEAGIPGPAGTGGADLSQVTFTPPLEYDHSSQTIRIQVPPVVGQAYRWNGISWEAFSISARRIANRTISSLEADDKELTLLHPVTNPASILFDIANGGGPKFLDSDFELVGNRIIRWAGGPLDGVLSSGDRVRIVYE